MERLTNLITRIIGFLMIVVFVLFWLFGGIILSAFICLASISIVSVPVTFIMSLLSGESYDRICDNSEILYRLNKIGRWSIVILAGAALAWATYLSIFG